MLKRVFFYPMILLSISVARAENDVPTCTYIDRIYNDKLQIVSTRTASYPGSTWTECLFRAYSLPSQEADCADPNLPEGNLTSVRQIVLDGRDRHFSNEIKSSCQGHRPAGNCTAGFRSTNGGVPFGKLGRVACQKRCEAEARKDTSKGIICWWYEDGAMSSKVIAELNLQPGQAPALHTDFSQYTFSQRACRIKYDGRPVANPEAFGIKSTFDLRLFVISYFDNQATPQECVTLCNKVALSGLKLGKGQCDYSTRSIRLYEAK